jgi:hypothetical protein
MRIDAAVISRFSQAHTLVTTEPEGNPLDRLRCPGIDQDRHPALLCGEAGAVLGARGGADRRVAGRQTFGSF